MEAGETFEQAALREAEEELGLKGFPIKFVWEQRIEFVYIDTPVCQHECFFLLEAQIQPLSAQTRNKHEQEGIVEMRWWTTSAIASTSESVFPEELASKLEKISN